MKVISRNLQGQRPLQVALDLLDDYNSGRVDLSLYKTKQDLDHLAMMYAVLLHWGA